MAASTDLTALAALKAYLGISGNDDDDALATLIDAASEAVENYCRRRFAETEYTEYHDGRASWWVLLKQRPATAVADVRDDLDRLFPASSIIDAGNYTFYGEEGILRLTAGRFQGGSRNVRVTYTAGYADVPDDIAQACAMLAASWFNVGRQGADGLAGESLGDYRADYAHQPLPREVVQLIVPYRNWDV